MREKGSDPFFYLPRGGLEPPGLAAPDPEPGVFTNFTTWAQ